MDKNLILFLDKHKIIYKIHNHPAVFTVEESKKLPQIINIPGLRMKNLFMKDENSIYYLICLEGEKRLDIKRLEKELNIRHLKFASSAELKKEMNLTPGSVSIFGLIYSDNVELILDKKAYDSPIISFHPNVNTSTLELTHDNLVKFIDLLKIKIRIMDI